MMEGGKGVCVCSCVCKYIFGIANSSILIHLLCFIFCFLLSSSMLLAQGWKRRYFKLESTRLYYQKVASVLLRALAHAACVLLSLLRAGHFMLALLVSVGCIA